IVRMVSGDSAGKQVAGVAAAASALGLGALAAWDLAQRKHSILRNYPVAGHARVLLESNRPEVQQGFIDRTGDGPPFNRDTRTTIADRAKVTHSDHALGTELDVIRRGYEALMHSNRPSANPARPPRVRIGGDECTQPYGLSLLTV